jgi:acyl carrier protein
MIDINKEQLIKELGEYIQALTGFELEISYDSTMSDMHIDSISLVKLFVFIEKQFGLSLVNAGLSRDVLESFGTLTDYIFAKIANEKS